MIFDGIWAAWKTNKLFGWLQQEPYTTPFHRSYCQIYIHHFFWCGKLCLRCFDTKKTRPLRDFEPISFWWCLFFCCPANLGPVNAGHSDAEVWTDSWLGSYRTISTQQVRPGAEIGRVSLWGWDEGVEVLKVITTGRCGATRGDDELWIWYQCILEGALIEGSDLLFASHKTSSKKARKK